LLQEHDVFYANRKLIQREHNYSVGEREALAIIWVVSKFRRFLQGQHFTLESDHRPLEYLQSSHPKNPRLMRWSLALQLWAHGRHVTKSSNFIAFSGLQRCHSIN